MYCTQVCLRVTGSRGWGIMDAAKTIRMLRDASRGYESIRGAGPALGRICGERCGERKTEVEGPWHTGQTDMAASLRSGGAAIMHLR